MLRAVVESHVGRGSGPQVERAAMFHLSMKELGHMHRLLLGDVPYHPYLVDARYRTSSQRDFTALLEPPIQLIVRSMHVRSTALYSLSLSLFYSCAHSIR